MLADRRTQTRQLHTAGRRVPGLPQTEQTVRIALMGALFLAAFLFSFSIGRYGVPVKEVVRIFFSKLIPLQQTWTKENVPACQQFWLLGFRIFWRKNSGARQAFPS